MTLLLSSAYFETGLVLVVSTSVLRVLHNLMLFVTDCVAHTLQTDVFVHVIDNDAIGTGLFMDFFSYGLSTCRTGSNFVQC